MNWTWFEHDEQLNELDCVYDRHSNQQNLCISLDKVHIIKSQGPWSLKISGFNVLEGEGHGRVFFLGVSAYTSEVFPSPNKTLEQINKSDHNNQPMTFQCYKITVYFYNWNSVEFLRILLLDFRYKMFNILDSVSLFSFLLTQSYQRQKS